MSKTTVKWEGMSKLRQRLNRALTKFREETVNLTEQTAKEARGMLKMLTPQDNSMHLSDRNEAGPHTNELWMEPSLEAKSNIIRAVVDHPYNQPMAVYQRSASGKPRLANDGADFNLLLALEFGVNPHPIIARPDNPRGLLRFYWEKAGKFVEFAAVNHPGIVDPAGMMDQTYKVLRPRYYRQMRELFRKLVTG